MNKEEVFALNNKFINSKYTLNTQESLVLYHILFKYHVSLHENTVETPRHVIIDLRDLRKLIKNKAKNTRKELMKIINELRKKEFCYIHYVDQKRHTTVTSFIDKIHFDEDLEVSQLVTVELDEDVLSFFQTQLSDGYTYLSILKLLALKSHSSQRLYMLCKQWANKGQFTMTLEQYRDMMCYIPNELGNHEIKFKTYSQLNQRSIKVAIKELKDKKLFDVSVIEHKVGRAVKSLTFVINEDYDEYTPPTFIEESGQNPVDPSFYYDWITEFMNNCRS